MANAVVLALLFIFGRVCRRHGTAADANEWAGVVSGINIRQASGVPAKNILRLRGRKRPASDVEDNGGIMHQSDAFSNGGTSTLIIIITGENRVQLPNFHAGD